MSVRRNTLINLAGSVAPIAVSLVVVPLYLKAIGDARYGVLAIVWLFVGYFGLFDLGMSRATANQIAKLKHAASTERAKVFWTALWLNAGFGVFGGLILYVISRLAFEGLFRIPSVLEPELVPALPWIALAIPVATLSGVLTGGLEGRGRFGAVNLIQIIGTIVTQVVPLAVALLRGPNLTWLIPSVIIARIVSALPLVWVAVRSVPLMRLMGPSRDAIRVLLGYGVWVAVTNLISPILEAVDRFLIGALLGVKSVTYYAIPYGLATRVNLLPGALSRTLFPVLSFEKVDDGSRIAVGAVRALASMMTPIVTFGILAMRPFLTVWVGADTAARSNSVGELILVGAWMNSLALIAFAQLQGQSRPNIVAKFHLMELLPFLAVLWFGLKTIGIAGAAGAWSLRVSVDAILLFRAAGYDWKLIRALLAALLLLVATCATAIFMPLSSVGGWIVGGGLFCLSICWALMLESPLRSSIFAFLHGVTNGGRRK